MIFCSLYVLVLNMYSAVFKAFTNNGSKTDTREGERERERGRNIIILIYETHPFHEN